MMVTTAAALQAAPWLHLATEISLIDENPPTAKFSSRQEPLDNAKAALMRRSMEVIF